ncbi:hypothetical protein MMC10_007574 [Thelotrema lepadinum]|nr:hypothetical protein [Thelotrema lepadinum]
MAAPAASASSGSPSTSSAATSTASSGTTSTTLAPTYIFSTPSLTEAFTPPAECTEGHITMLERQSYFIWENEPLPVPNSTFSECYPSQFMTSYLQSYSSTILPAFSPLVCPDNYQTIFSQAMTDRPMYIACCPSNYGLHPPDTSTPGRPAYGGTCYSNLLSVSVTQYDNSSSSGVMLFSTSGQAYAHPIDGFALSVSTSTNSSSTSNTTSAGLQPAASGSTSTPLLTDSSSQPHVLSSGAIAGIVIGSILGAALLLTGFILICVRRRRRQRRSHPLGIDPSMANNDRYGGPPGYSISGPSNQGGGAWPVEKALPPRPLGAFKHAELSTTPRYAPFQELPDHNNLVASELDSSEATVSRGPSQHRSPSSSRAQSRAQSQMQRFPSAQEDEGRSAWMRLGGRTPGSGSGGGRERSPSSPTTEGGATYGSPENSISPISAAGRGRERRFGSNTTNGEL